MNLKDNVIYVSGCGNEEDQSGRMCLEQKFKQFYIKTEGMKYYCVEAGKPCHDPYAPANDNVAPTQPANGDSTSNPNAPAVAAETTTNNSNNQNGALKFVGILEIGWMIFVAALIY